MSTIVLILLTLVAILLVFVILIFIFFAIDLFLDLPYVATDRKKIRTIIKLAQIKPKDTVVDLGSGDGRLLFAAAAKGARAIGYEINPFLVFLTRLLTKFKGMSGQVVIHKQNLWKADLKATDIIFVYGRKKTMQKFQDFVYKKAKRGTRIIVNTDKTVPFPTKKPIKSENGIYLYIL